MKRPATLFFVVCAAALPHAAAAQGSTKYPNKSKYDALVAHHAKINNVPEALVHRVIVRESKYQPHLIGKGGAMGMMQIKLPTARGVGYTGTAEGLLDAETNITYATRYLAGAWRLANGSHDQAVSHYARGYYYAAKRAGMLNKPVQVASRTGSTRPQDLVPKSLPRQKLADRLQHAPPRMEELTASLTPPAR